LKQHVELIFAHAPGGPHAWFRNCPASFHKFCAAMTFRCFALQREFAKDELLAVARLVTECSL
jgi:hypothetical protein